MDDENLELPWEYPGEMYHDHVSKPVNRMLRLNLLLLLRELGEKIFGFLSTAPCLWSAVLKGLAIGFGTLSISLAIALIWKTSDGHPHCPQQWVAYRESCYSFSTEKKDWNSSQESCRAQGAHLLVISDTLEMDLFKRIRVEYFWIGLRNSTSFGWIWEDGSVLSDARVHSNSPVQNCAVLWKDQFRASSCEVPALWICEKKLR